MSDYCIFILTHKNVDNVTIKTLRQTNVKAPIYFVVDDKDPCLEEYKKVYGDSVQVFSKDYYKGKFDMMDNFNFDKVVVFARNACFDIAEKLGFKYFIEMDDDYHEFAFRFPHQKWCHVRDGDFDGILNVYFDFYKQFEKLKILAFMSGGDFSELYNGVVLRKAMNVMFFSTDRRVEFKGRINEDVNTYSRINNLGDICISFPMIAFNQKRTQHGEGLTDAYLNYGTYVKSFYSVMQCPSFIKISVLNGTQYKRIHHNINKDFGIVKIISGRYKK